MGYPACAADPILATTTNVDGTRNVALAMEKGQKILFASTGSTYGKVLGIATEETPPTPLTLYGKTKLEGEEIIEDEYTQARRNARDLMETQLLQTSPGRFQAVELEKINELTSDVQ